MVVQTLKLSKILKYNKKVLKEFLKDAEELQI
jgi:hypothetical protein